MTTAKLILSRNIHFITNPIELHTDVRLREQHFGYFENKPHTIPVKYALTPPDRRLVKFVGEGAESLQDVFNRAMLFTSDLLSFIQRKVNSQQKKQEYSKRWK